MTLIINNYKFDIGNYLGFGVWNLGFNYIYGIN